MAEPAVDVDIPEVQARHTSARFFREAEKDFVEISTVGSKDTVIHRVSPEHMSRFREEWNAFCDGVPLKQRAGSPLMEIPGMKEQLAQHYVQQNVHTAEELAALSDAQCQALGHGTLTLRASARGMLEMRRIKQADAMAKRISEAAKTASSLTTKEAQDALDAKYATKEDVKELGSKLDAVLAALQPKKPGRPKKQPEAQEG